MRVYLCGPITNCTDEEATDWRQEAASVLNPKGITTLDPMVRDYRASYERNYRRIVEEDKMDIAMSDVVLVNYFKPSVGTSMEIIKAWENNKRVIIVHPEEAKLSPWLIYHSHNRYTKWSEAYAKIFTLLHIKNKT